MLITMINLLFFVIQEKYMMLYLALKKK